MDATLALCHVLVVLVGGMSGLAFVLGMRSTG